MDEITIDAVDVLRTRVVLAQLVGEQERLAAGLAASGLDSFADRADWLTQHRSADEQLAWRMRWLSLGVKDPAPQPERLTRPRSLAVRRRRRRIEGLLAPDVQMAIALRVYDALPAEQQLAWKRPRPFKNCSESELESERKSA